ncbi:MAG: TonB-dependent receptor [Bacteroidetes bacterium]|nr:TonB-dependent receptor [Bacteroidota bacterium]
MTLRHLVAFTLLLGLAVSSAAQSTVKGIVTDAASGETLIGASLIYAPGKGAATDIDGKYALVLDAGEYTIACSILGYKSQSRTIVLKENQELELNFALKSNTLREVEIVSDIAIARETPVAFTNLDPVKIKEELGAQDLPMLLNSTPGVYATQQGGGDGDARISIRGFNSQNVMILIDGIPMNDMVNGRVYWTNWFGLDQLTSGVQVQRGLGASKLAIPAIGGTMNILTSGMQNKKMLSVRQEVGNNLNLRTTVSYNSGKLNKGWGVSAAASYRNNQGYVNGLGSEMFFYYVKVEKSVKNHLFTFSAFGAPQTSNQRDFRVDQPIYSFSKRYAASLGVDTTGKIEYGRRYNPSWNFLRRTRDNENAPYEIENTSVNQFHKPIISLKHFVNIGSKFYLSNIVYASYGMGGGTQPNNTLSLDSTGQQSIQNVYNGNAFSEFNIYPGFGPDSLYKGMRRSANFLRKNYNEHQWYGALSTFHYAPNDSWDFSGGIDLRTYNGQVYSRVEDLWGGDLIVSSVDLNAAPNTPALKGDRITQHIERNVRWGGAFALAEYKAGNWSAFLNVSGSLSYYKQINHFLKNQIVLSDTTLEVGYSDTLTYNGVTYDRNSEGLRPNQTDWKQVGGFTVKGGLNYNLTERSNVFANLGHLNRAPLIQFVFRTDNREFQNTDNEEINSAELGYSYKSSNFSFNVNGYYTQWNNKPTTTSLTVNGEPVSTNATGMGALHRGIEFDGIYKVCKQFSLEAMVSYGDWKWNKIATATIFADDGTPVDTVVFDPRGVRVGDAAQQTYALGFRYEPVKGLYFKPKFTWFSRNYANFDPGSLQIVDIETMTGPNLGRQSWRMPDYGILDISAGYHFVLYKIGFDFRITVNNALDAFAITDAQSNQFGNSSTFNAASSSVYFLMGRRWLSSLTLNF